MTARIIDGKLIAAELRGRIAADGADGLGTGPGRQRGQPQERRRATGEP